MRLKLACLLLLALTNSTYCATIIVDANGTGDYPTIQAAINAAVTGDIVSLEPGTYTGDGNRDINFNGKAITVCGSTGDPNDIIINCQGTESSPHRGFLFNHSETSSSVVDGVSITNGFVSFAYISLYFGAGIYCTNSSPTISNCIISGNSTHSGGGICNKNSNPRITNCILSNNIATDGGGIYNLESSPYIYNCVFNNNSAAFYGGGICNSSNSNPIISNCIIIDNLSKYDNGGGIACERNSNPVIINCFIADNSVPYRGGGIYVTSSKPNIKKCLIINNSAGLGGGIANYNGKPVIYNCLIRNNSAGGDGGGFYNAGSSGLSDLNISNSTINNNSADDGGGLYNTTYATTTIKNCIIWGNTSSPVSGGSTIISYSDIQGGYSGTGNINADPVFVDDYHISYSSPCLDKGDPAFVAQPDETDIDGDPRIIAGRIDMGVDECTNDLPLFVPSKYNFSFQAAGLNSPPLPQNLKIINYGKTTLNWNLENICNWINIVPSSGSIEFEEECNLSINIEPNKANYGSNICEFLIVDPNADNSPQTIIVQLEVLRPSISKSALNFSLNAGGLNSDAFPTELTIQSTNYDSLNWHIEIPNDCNWLRVTPLYGQSTNEPTTIIIDADTNGLDYGLYSGHFFIIDPNAANSPLQINVSLQVLGPRIRIVPERELGFMIAQGDVNAVSKNLYIINSGYDTLDWQIECLYDCNWLTIKPASGQTSAKASQLIAEVNPLGLEPGEYHAGREIISPNAANSPQFFMVNLRVYAPSQLLVPQEYPTIQDAVNAAGFGAEIIIAPGIYELTSTVLVNKPVTIRSVNPNDPAIVAATIVKNYGFDLEVSSYEGFEVFLNGLTIKGPSATYYNGPGIQGGGVIRIENCTITNFYDGISLVYCDARISNCRIEGNKARTVETCGVGLYHCQSNSEIQNCIFADNYNHIRSEYASYTNILNCTLADAKPFYDIRSRIWHPAAGVGCQNGSRMDITNCIFYNNHERNGREIYADYYHDSFINLSFCNIDGDKDYVSSFYYGQINWWSGNINADPCFVMPGYMDQNGTPSDTNDDFWVNGDFHLKSEGWRWDNDAKQWTWDDVTSRCIDAGNPGSPLGSEPLTLAVDPMNRFGQNLRIDMGAYGGTSQASMPPYDWALLSDIDNNGTVDFADFAWLSENWLQEGIEFVSDFDRNEIVDYNDLTLFLYDWLNTTIWP